jgi:hypothetical protein
MSPRGVLAVVLAAALLSCAAGLVVQTGSDRTASAAQLPSDLSGHRACDETTAAGELHHAGLVIVFPDGTDTYCIAFEGDELTGLELLAMTGLPIVDGGFGGLGDAVCRIDDVGCSDPGNCWCQCRGADCHYWSYFELDAGEWDYLQIGASQHRVRDSDVVGWVWGNGRTPPGATSSAAICAPAQPTPVPTPTRARISTAPPPATATPMPPPGGGGDGRVVASTSAPPRAESTATSTAIPTTRTTDPPPATEPLRVVRHSTRPTKENEGARDNVAAGDADSGAPFGLLAFGVVAGGLVLAGGGMIARRKLRG